MTIKIKWEISPKNEGRFAAFNKRSWPRAVYTNGKSAGYIICDDSYSLRLVKSGSHGVLTLKLFDYSEGSAGGWGEWTIRTCKQRFKTLDEAKKALLELLEKYPSFIPSDIAK